MAIQNPTRNFLTGILNSATNLSTIIQTQAQAIVNGYQTDLLFVSKLVQRLCDLSALQSAKHVFFSVSEPDLFLFRILIKGFSENGFPLKSLSLYAHLRKKKKKSFYNLELDGFTYAYVVTAAKNSGEPRYGSLIHAQLIVEGLSGDSKAGSALMGFYFKFSNVDYARKVFDGMSERDIPLGNTAVSGLARNGMSREAYRVFYEMGGFNAASFALIFPVIGEIGDSRLGAGVHCLCSKLGFDWHVNVVTGLVSMYSKCREIGAAWFLFERIRFPDLVSFNVMIDGFTRNGDVESSVLLFKRLLGMGVRVSSGTIVGLIPISSPYCHSQLVSSIQSFSLKYGIFSDPLVSTAMVSVYSRLNLMEYARRVFDESPKEKKLASWNAMITGYAQNGLTELAISLFEQIMEQDLIPNATTLVTILSVCAQLGFLGLGKRIHILAASENLETNTYVQTALVDMYSKCGNIAKARKIFDSVAEKNTVTWNAMISGYGLHGNGNEAFKLFNEMFSSGVLPDRVTFLSALYACSHAGLVRVGEEVFKSMVQDHGIKPTITDYACMVDILSRAGHLEKALEFINSMSIEPDVSVWCSLLGACHVHKDSRIAKIASEKVLELDPENLRYYVTLSNIYTAKGSFYDAALVRRQLNVKKLKKTPGYALIEIDETTHLFKSGDETHPRLTEIYVMLDKLMRKMAESGYRCDTASALRDFEEEDKEVLVNVHSEKLAIAFGLVATKPGTVIRVIKNFRTCLDCHESIKLISKITERVIMVRDCNRFHQFKDGVCSCGDYW